VLQVLLSLQSWLLPDSAAKGGIIAFTKTLAKDVGQLVPLGGLFSQLDPFRFFPGIERSFYDYGPS